MKIKLLLLGLLVSTAMAEETNYEKNCQNMIEKAYRKKVERDMGILSNARQALRDTSSQLSQTLSKTLEGCVSQATSFEGIDVGLPGINELKNRAMNAANKALFEACNVPVNEMKSVINSNISKYTNKVSGNYLKTDFFDGIDIRPSVRY